VSADKRSVNVRGHRTSVSVEPEFWEALSEIAAREGCSIAALIGRIDSERGERTLSAAIRLYVLQSLKRSQGSN
jgi:predicted DNA-binding ribbon-helix-helix protein